MRKFIFSAAAIYLLLQIAMTGSSCKHEPLLDDELLPADTTPADTTPVDTGVPCDPNVVYFNQQVLPILISNCSFNGCHDSVSHEEGVILMPYESVMATGGVESLAHLTIERISGFPEAFLGKN
jgi:hypothetical protein